VLKFFHIPGKQNPADVLSKHYCHTDVWPLLEPILFWIGKNPYQDPGDVSDTSSTTEPQGGVSDTSPDSKLQGDVSDTSPVSKYFV